MSVLTVYKTTTYEQAVLSIDLSEQGAALPAGGGGCSEGDEITLSISVPPGETFSCAGEVAWVSGGRMGVRFVDISGEDRRRIGELLGAIEREAELAALLEDIEQIESALNNLENSRREWKSLIGRTAGLLRSSAGRITSGVLAEASKVPGGLKDAVDFLSEELNGELKVKRAEFRKRTSGRTDSDRLKLMAVCGHELSKFAGSLCGVKLSVLSHGEQWDGSKCEQCVRFRNW